MRRSFLPIVPPREAGPGFLNNGGAPLGGETDFFDTATADNGTFTNLGGGVPGGGGLTQFFDSSTAGNGTFTNLTGVPLGGAGHTSFFGTSTAGHATITNEATGSDAFIPPGTVSFNDMSDAGESLITSNGTEVAFGSGAFATFYDFSSGGNATIIANGGSGLNAFSATTSFLGNSTAGNAVIIANGNSSQSVGGLITFQESSSGGTSRIQLFGIGALDISFRDTSEVTIGSLEGDGEVHLGANHLRVGSNNLSTSFGGVIDGTGSLIKGGRGKLILNGASTYTGGTSIEGGTLFVAYRAGSATGNGPVQVNKGTLGGAGKIAGAVTVGNGIDAMAALSPGLIDANPAALSIQGTLTFRSLATYKVTLDSTTATADAIIANGITVGTGTIAFIQDIGADIIAVGTVFTIISNTSASPIVGTFGNLADNSSFTLNGNNFLVSYEGGDGNDLTLTVVP